MKKLLFSVFTVIMYFFIISQVQAAGSVSLNSSKQNVNVGDTFNISVKLQGASSASLTTRVGFDTQKVEYVSGPSNSNASGNRVIYTWTDPNGGRTPITGGNIATFTFKAKSEGTAFFTVSGDFFSPDETSIIPAFSGTSVVIKKVESGGNTGTNQGGNTGTNQGGNTGTNHGGNTGTNQGGNTGTNQGGNAGTNQGGNTGTNQGGNTGTNQNNKSSNNNLKSLQIDIEGISPKFNKNITQYYITIPNNVSNINVTASSEDSKSTIQINGNNNIPNGTSKINIVVTAENGKKKEYIINVTKTNNPELANSNLENLAIEGITLIPEFNSDITEYFVEFFEDVEKLNILAVPQRESATVNIEGNENLKYGENLIKITVLAEDGTTSKIYNIVANKKEKETENEENTGNTDNTNNARITENVEEQIDKNVKSNKLVWFILLGILAVLIIVIIIIVIKKRRDTNNNIIK